MGALLLQLQCNDVQILNEEQTEYHQILLATTYFFRK